MFFSCGAGWKGYPLGRAQLDKLLPLVFPRSAMLRKLWGRPPGLRGTPSSRIWNKWGQRLAGCEQADGGVGRGPGGPPHDLCRRPAPEKRVALACQAAPLFLYRILAASSFMTSALWRA